MSEGNVVENENQPTNETVDAKLAARILFEAWARVYLDGNPNPEFINLNGKLHTFWGNTFYELGEYTTPK